jgi:DNA-directed RNA polymerase subunit RPC12/RpoP
MYLFSYKDDKVSIECDGCGKVYMFKKQYFSQISSTECTNNTLIRCPNCGRQVSPYSKIKSKNDDVVRCPRCGSTQLATGNKGFGVGKAAVGAIIAGPIGLVGGFVGSGKTMITCLKCGNKWQAGKR